MKLGYVILYVPDISRALAFYQEAFGLSVRFAHESGTYAELDTGATTLAFASEDLAAGHGFSFRPMRPVDAPPAQEIGLVTGNVAADFERAVAAGAVPLARPEEKPWGQTVAYVRDPDGFLVELCSPVGG